MYHEEAEVFNLLTANADTDFLVIIRRLTNCGTSFLCTTADNTGRQDGKTKPHQWVVVMLCVCGGGAGFCLVLHCLSFNTC